MPAGIYIHIPFCLSKCYYCDFYSMVSSIDKMNDYTQCLIKEIKIVLPQYTHKKFDTIYIGGGTPSILKVRQLGQILSTLHKFIDPSNVIETTLEANPETLNQKKLLALKKIGINRLSIGVQSTQNRLLRLLNRVHNHKTAIRSIETARLVGFDNLNIDLIFGIPTQTLKDWEDTLEITTSYKPEHISVYNLTIEKGTPLEKMIKSKKLTLPDEDSQIKMFKLASNYLSKKNYKHYEISNYALKGFECKHNLKYWRDEEYLGIGVAAHSYMDNQRFFIPSNLSLYKRKIKMRSVPCKYDTIKNPRRKTAESLMMGLRLMEGVNLKDYQKKHNINIQKLYKSEIKELTDMRLLSINKDRMRLTKQGILVMNEVISKFF